MLCVLCVIHLQWPTGQLVMQTRSFPPLGQQKKGRNKKKGTQRKKKRKRATTLASLGCTHFPVLRPFETMRFKLMRPACLVTAPPKGGKEIKRKSQNKDLGDLLGYSTSPTVKIRRGPLDTPPREFLWLHHHQPISCTWYLGALGRMTHHLPWVCCGSFLWSIAPFTSPGVIFLRRCLQCSTPGIVQPLRLKFSFARAGRPSCLYCCLLPDSSSAIRALAATGVGSLHCLSGSLHFSCSDSSYFCWPVIACDITGQLQQEKGTACNPHGL